ncbi:MAG: hypothetical protein FWE44_00930 [Defluviitaleaceae bacterium]|nr:hypothetical protein [Defluviitaleaceae bacterium]
MNRIKKVTALVLAALMLLSVGAASMIFAEQDDYFASSIQQDFIIVPSMYFEDIQPMSLEEIVELEKIEIGEYFLRGNYTIIEFSPEEILAYQLMLHELGIDREIGLVTAVTIVVPGSLSVYEIGVAKFNHLLQVADIYSIEKHFEHKAGYNTILPQPMSSPIFETNNPRPAGMVRGTTPIASTTTSTPNLTLSINQQRFVSNSVTRSAGVSLPANVVSATVGFSTTDSTSVSVTGSWTTPHNSNGGRLHAYAWFNGTHFDVWRFNRNSWGTVTSIDFLGTELAKQFNGSIHFVGTAW